MDSTKKGKLIVKGVCLILSFVLWLYVSNVENPKRTLELKNVEVEILNEDVLSSSNLCILNDMNFSVDLKLEGKANDIYSVKKSDFNLKVDLSNYALKEGENNIPVEVIGFPDDIIIKNKSELTISLNLEEEAKKTVNVKSNVKTTFKDGASSKSITVSPTSVMVKGPESLVEKVESVVMEGEISDISKDISKTFRLIPIDSKGKEISGVDLSDKIGKVIVSVGNSKQVKVNAVYKGNLPENLILNGITLSSAYVNIVGERSVINSISQINTEYINLANIKESQNLNVKLELPEGAFLLDGSNTVTAYVEVSKKEDNIKQMITKKIDGIKVNLTDKVNTALTYEVNNISVEVSGNSKEVNEITSANIEATTSVSRITEAGEQEVALNVSLKNAGSSVKITSKPEKIKVIAK
ncbi:MAG: hypothetical protein E7213_02430 [Clostridium sp.]|jgi:YbbR domain-containing protein|nr:hypothetical protein [Clostridium sp.]